MAMYILIYGKEGYYEQDYTSNLAVSTDVEALKQRALEDKNVFDEQFEELKDDSCIIKFNPDRAGCKEYYLIYKIDEL